MAINVPSYVYTLIWLAIVVFCFWYMGTHPRRGFSIFAALLAIGLLFFAFTYTEMYQNIRFRFENTDFTTGRISLLWGYIKYMIAHPQKWLFGIGMQRMNVKARFDSAPHKGLFEAYVGLDLVGLFAIIYLVFKLFFLYRDKYIYLYDKKPSFSNYIPFLVYVFFIQSFQFVKISYIFVPLSLVYLCILAPRADTKEERI